MSSSDNNANLFVKDPFEDSFDDTSSSDYDESEEDVFPIPNMYTIREDQFPLSSMEDLLEKGLFDIRFRETYKSQTFLHVNHDYDKAKLAIKYRADVNAQNSYGDTPLMECINNHGLAYRCLLENGANLYIKNNYGDDIFSFLDKKIIKHKESKNEYKKHIRTFRYTKNRHTKGSNNHMHDFFKLKDLEDKFLEHQRIYHFYMDRKDYIIGHYYNRNVTFFQLMTPFLNKKEIKINKKYKW